MTPGVRSKASASAGSPSVTRLIQRICAAVSGSISAAVCVTQVEREGQHRAGATSSTSERFVENRKRRNFWMFS